jgi:phosphoketolase
MSLADVTGTLAAMTASGMSADQATQNMADTLRHLANPTNDDDRRARAARHHLRPTWPTMLSTKGLAGTLQTVERRSSQHMDPAGGCCCRR